ncbi:hypothetical protein QZH41_020077, partial [Actinostola sp. cb2023]
STTMDTLLTEGAILFNKSKETVIYASLIVSTLVLEEVFQKVVFRCPCKNYQYYGLLFLLGPAVFLFMVGILLNSNTWTLLSKFKRRCKTADGGRRVKRCRVVCLIGEIVSKALLSPSVWLILSFLQKTFFVCAVFGPVSDSSNSALSNGKTNLLPCSSMKMAASPYTEAQLMALSQMIGLTLLITATFGVVVVAFISKCCAKRTFRLPGEKFYKRVEAKAAAREFHRQAKQKAEDRGKKVVESLLEEMERKEPQKCLDFLSEAGSILDSQYSQYYYSALRLTDRRRQDRQDQARDGFLSPECILEEDVVIDSYFFVDGSSGVQFESEWRVVNDGCIATSVESQHGHGTAQHSTVIAQHGHSTVIAQHGHSTVIAQHGHSTVIAQHGHSTARSQHGHSTARSQHGHSTARS